MQDSEWTSPTSSKSRFVCKFCTIPLTAMHFSFTQRLPGRDCYLSNKATYVVLFFVVICCFVFFFMCNKVFFSFLGSVERCNQDVENMLRSWMSDNNSTEWSLGCYFVQFQKNSSHHRTIGRSPYKALFGHDPVIGLSSTYLPRDRYIVKIRK